jgi:hypothetical protein
LKTDSHVYAYGHHACDAHDYDDDAYVYDLMLAYDMSTLLHLDSMNNPVEANI